MPEGPEATFLTHYISNHFKNKYLEDIEIIAGRYIRHGTPANFDAFKKSLPLKLKEMTKKGKVIFFYFLICMKFVLSACSSNSGFLEIGWCGTSVEQRGEERLSISRM